MIKKLFSIFFVFLFLNSQIHAQENLKCATELTSVFERVQRLPEANEVISQVLQEGTLHIELNTELSDQFGGYWSFFDRTIYITKTDRSSDCFLVSTLLFELHNASRNSDLKEIAYAALNGQIERRNISIPLSISNMKMLWLLPHS